MKILKFIFIAACLIAVTACVEGGSPKPSVDDDTRIMTDFTVPESGTAAYTGSGDFEGFSISFSNPDLAGRTIYLEKIHPDYSIDGYAAVSDIYAVRFTDGRDDTTEVFSADITVPYSSAALAAEGGVVTNVSVCSVADGSATAYNTEAGEGTYVTASVVFPRQFFSGYKGGSVQTADPGVIVIKGVSYADAASTMDDPAGTAHPDVVRGIRFVQPGEKVILGINSAAFGDTVLTYAWNMGSVPAGSAGSLTADGSDVTFIPDKAGIYEINLALTGANGADANGKIRVLAQNYSYTSSLDDASCFLSCHDGSVGGTYTDKYGRLLFRDLITAWGGTKHATAFTSVAAETDSSCFQCHTTGFFFADRNNDGADEYSAAAGYDDTIADWAAPNGGDDHLKGVACEACHGPGAESGESFEASHYGDTPITSTLCLSCHEHGNITGHFFEYSTAHDNAYTLANGNVAKNASCFKCHTGEGAMSNIYDAGITPATADTITGVGCAVCHDPHGEDGNTASLRLSGNADLSLESGAHTVDAGNGRICYNCHTADMTLPAVGSIPHNSQAEMLQGVGGYLYGSSSAPVRTFHVRSGLTCNDCHMIKQAGKTHDFDMSAGTAERISACSTACHSVIGDPVYSNGHYDFVGQLAPVRARIDELKETINSVAGLPADTAIKAFYTSENEVLATALNRAAYNYNFIAADRSYGLHNSDYTEKLIDLSLADLADYTGE